MKISVLIPAYNAAATIKATLDSVLAQTAPADEILVFDDGSTDSTAAVLESYRPRVTVFLHSNHGVAYARNFLCERARGDVAAFLDSDDIWHPRYLEAQRKMIESHPAAAAYFTSHEDMVGLADYNWPRGAETQPLNLKLIEPTDFIKRLNKTPLIFQMSCCCVRKTVLSQIGLEPFRVSGAEDTYFLLMLPLLGPVIQVSARLSAYRITERSLSSNRLKVSVLVLDAFRLLDKLYKSKADATLCEILRAAHASRKRNCGKFLMGSGKITDARTQFKESLTFTCDPLSISKSLGLLFASCLPAVLQPKWPMAFREITPSSLIGRAPSVSH
jgi:glycosyltransferase involved in cell wall biosynthesis